MSMKLEDTILQAIDIIANKRIANAGYDKTIQATIVSCVDATIGKYKVKYQDSILFAYSGNTDTTYSKGANVYVLVPGGNMNSDKTILGTTQKLGINYINISEEIDKYRPIGNNVITSFSRIGLTSYRSQQRVKYRNSETVITSPIDINTIAAEEYLSKSKYFAIKCNIQTDLEDVQKGRGDYGIIVKMRFNDNSGEGTVVRNYMLNIDQMAGNPYNFEAKSPQYIVFSIDNQNFIKIQEISFFTKDFPNQNDTYTDNNNADIFFSDFEIQALQAIQEQNLNGYNLIIRQPHGHAFFEEDSNSKKIEFVGQVRVKNEIVDLKSQSIDFYWFIENPRITTASAQYNKMYGGQGWKLIQSGSNILELTKADVITETTKYKCTVSYDGIIFSRQFEVKNFDAEYRLTIESSDGTVFYLDSGNPTLQCICTKKQGTIGNLTYSWSYVDNNGIFRTVTEDNTVFDIVDDGVGNKGVVNIKQITTFMTFKCAVSQTQGGRYLGTAAITLRNILEAKFATYSMVINNASQVFKYNELGVSPASKQNIKPIEIPTLSFSVYSPEGDIIDSQTIRVNGSIKWRVPKNNTMLNIPGGTPSQTTDDEYIFTNQKELSYTIADRFNFSGTNNTIILQVNYDNTLLVERTNLNFIKEGAAGTNGTDFVCKIVPQVTDGADIPVYPTIYYNGFNVTKNWNSGYLNVQFWHNGELIFDGNTSGNTEQGMPLTVTWEVLKNHYAGINENRIEDNTNLEINSTNGLIALKSGTTNIQDYINYHPANLIKATVQYQNHTYYGFIPIITVRLFNNSYKVDLKEWSGFVEALYTSSGLYPSFDEHQPFTLVVKQNNDDVSLNKTITYEWHLQGSIREKQANGSWLPPKDNTEGKWLSQAYVSGNNPLQKNQYKVKPTDKYDGECVNTGLSCVVKNNSTIVAWIHIPIHLLRNAYENSAINGWDGNSVELGQDNGGMILAPQVGAGVKQSDNSFTGMFIGTAKDPKQNLSSNTPIGGSNQDVGLFGYSHGNRSVFIDAKTGKATFGVSNQGQIIIDPGQNTAQIKSSNYHEGQNGSGMMIDFAKPQIKFGSGNFSVNENGQITATAGNIQGDLITSGHIKDQSGGDNFDLDVETGELKVKKLKIISGGTGARNLLLQSETKKLQSYQGSVLNFTQNVSVSEWGANNAIRVSGTIGPSYKTFAILYGTSGASNNSIEGVNYIHSIYIKNQGNTVIEVTNNGLGGLEVQAIQPSTQKRIILYGTGVINSQTGKGNNLQFNFRVVGNDATSFDFIYWHPQIEIGTIPSDWSMAPEDLQTAIHDVKERWSEWIQSDDGFKASVDERIKNIKVGGTNILRGTSDMLNCGNGEWEKNGFAVSRTPSSSNTSFIEFNANLAKKVSIGKDSTNEYEYVLDTPIFNISHGVIIDSDNTGLSVDSTTGDFIYPETQYYTGFYQRYVPLAANRTITMSCWVKGKTGDKVYFWPWWIPPQNNNAAISSDISEHWTITQDDIWMNFSFTCKSPSYADLQGDPYIYAGYVYYQPKRPGNQLTACGLMMEYATVTSGWAVSPYDYTSGGDNLFVNPEDNTKWPVYRTNGYYIAKINLFENLIAGNKYVLTLYGDTPTRTDKTEKRYSVFWGGSQVQIGYVYMNDGFGSLTFKAPYKNDFKTGSYPYQNYDADTQNAYIMIYNGTIRGTDSATTYSARITKARMALATNASAETIITKHSDWIQTADGFQATVTKEIETITHINLLPPIYYRENMLTSENNNEYVYADITWTLNQDGSVRAQGIASGGSSYAFCGGTKTAAIPVITLDPSKQYTLSGCPLGSNGGEKYRINGFFYTEDIEPNGTKNGDRYADTGDGLTVGPGYKYCFIYATVYKDANISNGITFYPMLEVGTQVHAYQSTHNGIGAITGRIVTAESNIQQTSESIKTTVKKLDSLKIKAKNILRGTQFMRYASSKNGWFNAGFYTSGSDNGTVTYQFDLPSSPIASVTKGVKITIENTENKIIGFAQGNCILKGETLTQSVWVNGYAGDQVVLQPYWKTGQSISHTFTIEKSSVWVRYSYTFTTAPPQPNTSYNVGYVYIKGTNGHNTWVCAPMLEYGDELSDWQPSSDYSEDIILSSAESTIEQTADEISTKVTEVYNNLQGINLLPPIYYRQNIAGNTYTSNGITWTVNSDNSVTAKGTATATSIYSLTGNTKTAAVPVIPVNSNTYYTFSHGTTGGNWQTSYSMQVQYYDINMNQLSPNHTVASSGPSSWNISNQAYVFVRLIIANGYSTPSAGIRFYPMMERGQIAHDYISSNSTEGLKNAESQITQHANDISLVVTGTGANRKINRAAIVMAVNGNNSSVAIEADNIDLDGKNIVLNGKKGIQITSPNFTVSTTGTVTAKAGTFGGWSITDKYIQKYGSYTVGTSSKRVNWAGLYAPASPTKNDKAFAVAYASYNGTSFGDWNYPFYVTYEGKMVATSADITGTINSTSGSIAGWNLASDSMDKTSSAPATQGRQYQQLFYMPDEPGPSNGAYRVRYRDYTNGTAGSWVTPFYVSYGGVMHASSADITGGSINITTDSSTSDKIKLSYNEWTSAMTPLGYYAYNSSTTRRAVLQGGGIFLQTGATSITGGGTPVVSITATSNTTGSISVNRTDGTAGGSLFVNSGGGGTLYLYDTNSTLRANLNDGGLYLYGTSGESFTTYGQHAIDFMPKTSSSNNGGWIDFHYNRSTSDFTSRLIGTSGSTTAMPSITNGSDRRMKEDIEYWQSGNEAEARYIEFINRLNPVRYKYKKFDGTHFGFIAQDIVETCNQLGIDASGLIQEMALYEPEGDNTKYLSLNYIDIIAFIVNYIQKLNKEIKELKNGGN